jgi:hypothetical protein
MEVNYDAAFSFVMAHEGYKSDDPDDKGGRTIFGISERTWPAVVAALWDLPQAEALARAHGFYRENYWRPTGCDFKKWPYDLFIFDTAINVGVARANNFYLVSDSPTDYLMRRIEFYVKITLGVNRKYLRGWIKRVVELYREGMK